MFVELVLIRKFFFWFKFKVLGKIDNVWIYKKIRDVILDIFLSCEIWDFV